MNQEILGEIAKNGKNIDVCLEAVKKITNENILSDIAKSNKDENLSLAIVDKLTDQDLLFDIYRNAVDYYVRVRVVDKLFDQKLLTLIVKNEIETVFCNSPPHPPIQHLIAAVINLEDQDTLAYVARNNRYYKVRIKAIEKLKDYEILLSLAKEDEDADICIAAARQLFKNFDLKENIITELIDILSKKYSDSENEETRNYAKETLMDFHNRYKKY